MPLPVSLGAATGIVHGGCRCFSCQVRQHTETAPAPATKATVLRNPLPKKKTQEKPAETRCFCCRAAAGAAALCRSALPAPPLCRAGCRWRCGPPPLAALWAAAPAPALLLPLAAGFAAPAHRGRQRKQRVSPALSKREFSLESLRQSVAPVAGPGRGARLCWCRCCRSGPPCAALRAAVCRFGKPPLPLWARRCRVDGAAALRASAAVAVRWSWRPRCGSLPPLPPLLCAVVARCGLRATAPPFAALRGPAAGGCHVRRS